MTTPPSGAEVCHITYPAGTIRFHRVGSHGPAIILLHGGGLDNGMLAWRHTIPALATDHQVYVPDLPGQGGSVPWRGRADQRTCEEVLRWLCDDWGVPGAILVGLGMGGSIATGFALRHPRRVHGLVLVNPEGMRPRFDRHRLGYLTLCSPAIGTLLGKTVGMHRSLVRELVIRSVFSGTHPIPGMESIVDDVHGELRARGSAYTEWQRDAVAWSGMRVNHLPRLPEIQCRTLIVQGADDLVVPPECSKQAAAAIPGATLRVLDGSGHWLPLERPAEFNALLRGFIHEHSAASHMPAPR
jgi:pimeloyl-ACP methyl ester carboxylesterase